MAMIIFSSLLPQRWPARVCIHFMRHDLDFGQDHNTPVNLNRWKVTGVGKELGAVDVTTEMAIAWNAAKQAAATKKKRKAPADGGDGKKSGDFIDQLAFSMKVGRRPLPAGEFGAVNPPPDTDAAGLTQSALIQEFKTLLEESDDEDEPGKEKEEEQEQLDEPPLPPPAHEPSVDIEFIKELDLFVNHMAGGSSGSGGSGGGAGPSVANESLDESLARLKLRASRMAYPMDLETMPDIVDSEPRPVGRLYFVWGRTFKMTCRCHKNCSIMLNTNWFPSADSARRATLEWAARAVQSSEDEHFSEARRVLKLYKPQ